MSHVNKELFVVLEQALKTDLVVAELVELLRNGLLGISHLTVLLLVGLRQLAFCRLRVDFEEAFDLLEVVVQFLLDHLPVLSLYVHERCHHARQLHLALLVKLLCQLDLLLDFQQSLWKDFEVLDHAGLLDTLSAQ